jgi:uncharacterized damage-inducible protein DinB
MSIADSFLPDFDHEMANTRRILERVPADKWDWKPHAKSRTLGELATHVGELPRWGTRLKGESFQVGSEKAPVMRSAPELVARLEANAAAARESLSSMSDADLEGQFRVLKPDGSVFFQLPRRAVPRSVLMNHLVHHRGQLTVYLRLLDVPLPTIYGPTADESI